MISSETFKFLKWVNMEYPELNSIEDIIENFKELKSEFNEIFEDVEVESERECKKSKSDNIDESKMYVKKYTEKSYAVFGNTKPKKDELKTFGCKWVTRFSQGDLNGKCGWVFPSSKFSDFKKQFVFELC